MQPLGSRRYATRIISAIGKPHIPMTTTHARMGLFWRPTESVNHPSGSGVALPVRVVGCGSPDLQRIYQRRRATLRSLSADDDLAEMSGDEASAQGTRRISTRRS